MLMQLKNVHRKNRTLILHSLHNWDYLVKGQTYRTVFLCPRVNNRSKLQELLQKVKLVNMAERAAKMDRSHVQDHSQPVSHKE